MAWADSASTAAAKFTNLSVPRQIGLLFGLAASIALGVAVVLWSREPTFVPLFSQLNPRDSSEVLSELERNGMTYQIDKNSGTILIPADDLQTTRLRLAAEGLPRDSDMSTDFFSNAGTFNTSQFMENARYKQALEAELARTISKFNDIKAARVHLAIPRDSAFVRDTQEPSASVFLDVYSGYHIQKHTIGAIVNLVASSIPNLSANRVTIVDQDGQLLSEGSGQNVFSETDRFMDYRQNLEQQYAQKIQDILTPILGFGRVRAKVSADLDFTTFEQTKELYNPDQTAVRSEQTLEESKNLSSGAGGVPGTPSNLPQPNPKSGSQGASPANAASGQAASGNASSDSQAKDFRTQTTKNYELDKTISHTKNQPGNIKRLTVAVLVDNHAVIDEKTKKVSKKPLTQKEIEQIKLLVSDAIGLNIKRGDSLNVINSDFVKPEPIASMPVEKFWQKDWFWSIIKQVAGAFAILLLLFGVLKPMMRTLANNKDVPIGGSSSQSAEVGYDGNVSMKDANDFDAQLSLLRQVVSKEPNRVAQVVKTWVDRG